MGIGAGWMSVVGEGGGGDLLPCSMHTWQYAPGARSLSSPPMGTTHNHDGGDSCDTYFWYRLTTVATSTLSPFFFFEVEGASAAADAAVRFTVRRSACSCAAPYDTPVGEYPDGGAPSGTRKLLSPLMLLGVPVVVLRGEGERGAAPAGVAGTSSGAGRGSQNKREHRNTHP